MMASFISEVNATDLTVDQKNKAIEQTMMSMGRQVKDDGVGMLATLRDTLNKGYEEAFVPGANVAKNAADAITENIKYLSALSRGVETPEITKLLKMRQQMAGAGVVIDTGREIGKLQGRISIFGKTAQDMEASASTYRSSLEKIVDSALEAALS